MSLGKLIASTILDLALILVIGFVGVLAFVWGIAPTPAFGLLRTGQALGLPVRADEDAPWHYSASLNCTAVPANDNALIEWVQKQPDIHNVIILRLPLSNLPQGETLRVQVEYDGPAGLPRLEVPWGPWLPGRPPNPWKWWTRMTPAGRFHHNDDVFVLIADSVPCKGDWCWSGYSRIWRNRRLAALEPADEGPPSEDESEPNSTRAWQGRGVFVGILAGFVLGAFYWACDQAYLHFWGPPQALTRLGSVFPVGAGTFLRTAIRRSGAAWRPSPLCYWRS